MSTVKLPKGVRMLSLYDNCSGPYIMVPDNTKWQELYRLNLKAIIDANLLQEYTAARNVLLDVFHTRPPIFL